MMVVMRTLLGAWLVIEIGTLLGCHSDGPGLCPSSSWCEDDKLMSCMRHCTNEVNCSREVTVAQDCGAIGGKVGVAMTCGEITTGNNSDVETCVDAERIPCDMSTGGTVFCSPVAGRFRACQATPDGYFWRTMTTNSCPAEMVCRNVDTGGAFCYTPPGEPCTAGTPNACDPDGKTLIQCQGNAADGYVVTRYECTTGAMQPGTCGLVGSTYGCK
jgi:hypothetical protein